MQEKLDASVDRCTAKGYPAIAIRVGCVRVRVCVCVCVCVWFDDAPACPVCTTPRVSQVDRRLTKGVYVCVCVCDICDVARGRIHTDHVFVGNIGAPERMKVGRAVASGGEASASARAAERARGARATYT